MKLKIKQFRNHKWNKHADFIGRNTLHTLKYYLSMFKVFLYCCKHSKIQLSGYSRYSSICDGKCFKKILALV